VRTRRRPGSGRPSPEVGRSEVEAPCDAGVDRRERTI
jgi:hypothetical protein